MNFPTLVGVIAVMLLILKIIKASAKLVVSSVVIAVAVYFVMYILPSLL